MFSVCELCDVVVEKVLVVEAGEYGCESCWSEYGEIHQDKCPRLPVKQNYKEKDKAMNVSVKLNDNTTIYPSYAPEHKAEVIGFYTKKYWTQEIQGFKATMDDGTIVAIGAN